MKRHAALIFSAVLAGAVVISGLVFLAGHVGAGPATHSSRAAGAPPVISYQGQVSVDGNPYSGTSHFKFAVVDPTGTISYWSNDGNSTGGGEPAIGVPLAVSDGLFAVLLGDTGLSGMTEALSVAVFESSDSYLRVWFSADDMTYQVLDPDRRIAAVPYALQAEVAADADTVDGQHAAELGVPAGAMLLGASEEETSLTDAGFSYTGRWIESWTTRADLPTGRLSLAAVAVDGVIYAVGGSTIDSMYQTTNESYNPAADQWTTRAPMNVGRQSLAVAEVDGVIYAIGGRSAISSCETTVEAYYPLTDTWETKAPMPTGRACLAAAAVDGIVYAIGGRSCSENYETAVEAFDPATDTWANRMPMDKGRVNLAAAAAGGIIYAIGGQSAGGNENLNEAYDPVYNSWTPRSAMLRAGSSMSAVVIDGVIFVNGPTGPFGDEYETINHAYDPTTNSWQTRAVLPTGRGSAASAEANGVLYILGGASVSGGPEWRNEAYVPPLYIYQKD